MSQQETITLLPLEIQWQGELPIYQTFTADSLRNEMNRYFQKKNKNIRIRQISYEEVKNKVSYYYGQNENFMNYQDYEAIANQKYKSQNVKDYNQMENVYQQIKISNPLFAHNMKAFANLYLYSNPNLYLTSTSQLLLNNFPRFESKTKAWIEIPREQYDSYDSFCFRIGQNHDNIILRHPSQHVEYQKVKRMKKSITNWTISFQPSSETISHFADFSGVSSVVSRIKSNIIMKSFIFHQNSEQFEIISEIFNGIVFKFIIKNSNVKYCRLFQQNLTDTFYFSLLQEPLLYAVVQDQKSSKDIEYQHKWLSFPSFLNSCKSYSFRNHFVFNQYFINSNVISVQTEKLSQTSLFFRGFCYKIKQRFDILNKPMKQISIHKIISQLKDNEYQQMIGNMFINSDIKSQLVYILRQLMVNGQLSMIDTLELFSIKSFAMNVETYLSVLQMMISHGGQGIQWVKTMYNSLINICLQQGYIDYSNTNLTTQ